LYLYCTFFSVEVSVHRCTSWICRLTQRHCEFSLFSRRDKVNLSTEGQTRGFLYRRGRKAL